MALNTFFCPIVCCPLIGLKDGGVLGGGVGLMMGVMLALAGIWGLDAFAKWAFSIETGCRKATPTSTLLIQLCRRHDSL